MINLNFFQRVKLWGLGWVKALLVLGVLSMGPALYGVKDGATEHSVLMGRLLLGIVTLFMEPGQNFLDQAFNVITAIPDYVEDDSDDMEDEEARFLVNPATEQLFALIELGRDLNEPSDLLVVKQLLDQGANVDAVNKRGETLLTRVVVNGHLELLKLLLEAGANPNLCNEDKRPPLYWAFFHARYDMARYLLRGSAQIDLLGEGIAMWNEVATTNENYDLFKVFLLLLGHDLLMSPVHKNESYASGIVIQFCLQLFLTLNESGKSHLRSFIEGEIRGISQLMESQQDVGTLDDLMILLNGLERFQNEFLPATGFGKGMEDEERSVIMRDVGAVLELLRNTVIQYSQKNTKSAHSFKGSDL